MEELLSEGLSSLSGECKVLSCLWALPHWLPAVGTQRTGEFKVQKGRREPVPAPEGYTLDLIENRALIVLSLLSRAHCQRRATVLRDARLGRCLQNWAK